MKPEHQCGVAMCAMCGDEKQAPREVCAPDLMLAVKEFTVAFGQPVGVAPTADLLHLRQTLLEEEAGECRTALDALQEAATQTIPPAAVLTLEAELLDGLVDTVYIALGTLVTFGMRLIMRSIMIDLGNNWHSARKRQEDVEDHIAAAGHLTATLITALEQNPRYEVSSAESDALAHHLAAAVMIAIGAALVHGWDFGEAFARVHASNMSKLDADGKPVISDGTDGHPKGKILKSERFFKPDLLDLVGGA